MAPKRIHVSTAAFQSLRVYRVLDQYYYYYCPVQEWVAFKCYSPIRTRKGLHVGPIYCKHRHRIANPAHDINEIFLPFDPLTRVDPTGRELESEILPPIILTICDHVLPDVRNASSRLVNS